MKRSAVRVMCRAVCAMAVVAGSTLSADAGLIPWVYNAIFGTGPSYAGYGPTYASYGYAPMGWGASYASYYTPAYSYASYAPLAYDAGACCAPSCCPAPCGPCGVACGPGGCPGGNCGITYDAVPPGAPISPQPDAAGGPPPTYLEDAPMGTTPGTPPSDEGFRRRTPEQEQNEDVFDPGTTPPAGTFGAGQEQSDAFKAPESLIPQRRPAPSGVPDEAEPGPQIDASELRVPPLDLDDKITWRTPPQRTRLAVAASYATPVVARAKVDPNSNWMPVASDTRLAKK